MGSLTPRGSPTSHQYDAGDVAFDRSESLGTPDHRLFGAHLPCPSVPLPTLRLPPHGNRRTARGETWIGYSFVPGDFHPLPSASSPGAPDPYVRFGESTPDVHSLIVYEHFKEHRWAGKPTDWIAERCSRSDYGDQGPDELWDLLYRFARISMRQYAIRSDRELSDPAARKILWSPLWPKLRTLLEKHGRLDIVDKPASGPKSDWFHLVSGSEFLHPKHETSESTKRILEELNVRW